MDNFLIKSWTIIGFYCIINKTKKGGLMKKDIEPGVYIYFTDHEGNAYLYKIKSGYPDVYRDLPSDALPTDTDSKEPLCFKKEE